MNSFLSAGVLVQESYWLPGADAIYGAASYNLYWETRWLDLAARTALTPLPSALDDQASRFTACAGHRMAENGADVLARLLMT